MKTAADKLTALNELRARMKEREGFETCAPWIVEEIDKILAEPPEIDPAIKAMEDVLRVMASQGLQMDLIPTHAMDNLDSVETFWHRYIAQADQRVRESAQSALEDAGLL